MMLPSLQVSHYTIRSIQHWQMVIATTIGLSQYLTHLHKTPSLRLKPAPTCSFGEYQNKQSNNAWLRYSTGSTMVKISGLLTLRITLRSFWLVHNEDEIERFKVLFCFWGEYDIQDWLHTSLFEYSYNLCQNLISWDFSVKEGFPLIFFLQKIANVIVGLCSNFFGSLRRRILEQLWI